MKPTKHILLTIALLLCSLTASAEDFSVDGIYYNITSSTNKTVEVTYKGNYYNSYSNEYSGSITLPATVTYNGVTYSVTSIGNSAFYGCSSLTSITIPESVTSIGYYAFSDCSSLTAITIPEGVTSIGNSAFSGCSSLTTITIPESVTSIEKSAFNGTAWYDDQPDGVLYIGKMLYNYKGNMPENTAIEVKEGTVSISPCAFQSCSNLTAITIPESVTSIGDWAFDGCIGLTDITIPGSVSLIRDGAFANCTGLTSIIIPENMTSIANFAFYYCRGLISITIPASVTSVGHYSFEGCSSLTSITIPESVTSIRDDAFSGCSSLTAITVAEGNAKYDSRGGCNAIIETNSNTLIAGCSTTIIPESVTSIGGSAFYACSSLTAITIPESVTSIGDDAFRGCWNLTAITIPASVTSIGDYTFSNCSSLTSITIPESVTSIGYGAFSGCRSLTDITCEAKTPPTLEGSYVFYLVNKSIPLYVPAGSVEAYKSAQYWSEFTNIQAIPSSDIASGICGDNLTWRLTEEYELVIEGTGDMYDYTQGGTPWNEFRDVIKDVALPEGITKIGDGAFYNCSILTAINIPGNVIWIGGHAFENCGNLISITTPEGEIEICVDAFLNTGWYNEQEEGWLYLSDWFIGYKGEIPTNTDLIIREGTKGVVRQLFFSNESRNNIKSVTIPSSVIHICLGSFHMCDGIESLKVAEFNQYYDSRNDCNAIIRTSDNTLIQGCPVTIIPDDITAIDVFSFAGLKELTSIYIPANVKSLGLFAFSQCENLTTITCHALIPPICNGDVFSFDKSNANLYVPSNSVEVYKSAEHWNEFTNILPIEEPTPDYVTITISKYGSGTYSSAYALDFCEVQGLKAYVATGYNHLTGEVTLLRVHTAEAGMGLLVKGTPGVSYEVPILESTANHTLNMLVATLEKTMVNGHSDDGVYANYKYTVVKEQSPEPLFYQFADGASLSAGKAYLQIPVAWLPAKEEKARSIRLRFDEGETTDMEETTDDGGQSIVIYDLYGRRVVSPKKGEIYIINNQKVIY